MDVRVNAGSDIAAQVQANPAFVELATKRGAFGWALCIAMLVIYYGFILMVGYGKGLLATDIGGGVTLAFPIGLFVILSAVVITGLYVLRANGEFDELTRRIREAVR
jgi:uncharacterized membrane protein (DUF485 family)